jgi:hypothetical protein
MGLNTTRGTANKMSGTQIVKIVEKAILEIIW